MIAHLFMLSCKRLAAVGRMLSLPLSLSLVLLAGQGSACAEAGASKLPAGGNGPIQIELLPVTALDHAQVTLAEIAHISGPDNAVLQRLKNLPLGALPRTGEVLHLDREMLARWIHNRVGIDNAGISWSGAQANDIHFIVSVLHGDQIASRATQSLQSVLAAKGMRADVGISQVPRDLTVPAGEIELRVRPFADVALMAKHQSAWVDIWIEGRFFRTVPVGLEVSVFAPAYVLTRDLREGQALEPAALEVREVEWSGQSSLPLAVDGAALPAVDRNLSTLRSRRPLHAGDTLTHAAVETAPLVVRGDYATLHTVQGGIELESRVEVLEDGAAGQAVRVKLNNASSAIVARVSGPGSVEVRE